MFKAITRFAALALVFAAATLWGPVSAQDAARYQGNYLSGMVGLNSADRSNVFGTGISTTAKFDNGWAGGTGRVGAGHGQQGHQQQRDDGFHRVSLAPSSLRGRGRLNGERVATILAPL